MNVSPPLSADPQPFGTPHFDSASRDERIAVANGSNGEKRRSPSDAMKRVAALSAEQILELKRSESIDLIRSVRSSHLRPGVIERLPQMDGITLRRLVFLTRRYCRHRLLLAETNRSPSTYAIYCS
jgi:hypothetical protein